MKNRTLLLVGVALLFLLGACAGQQTGGSATAILRDAEGNIVGDVLFLDVLTGVKVFVNAHDLPPGVHGFHIHETGECTAPDFKSAGGHFNPYAKQHGLQNPEGHHVGDLPNLELGEDGRVYIELFSEQVTLAPGKNSLLKQPDRTAVVIHADADDEVSDPSGNAGARIACGVVQELA